jgi:hypothetical protein
MTKKEFVEHKRRIAALPKPKKVTLRMRSDMIRPIEYIVRLLDRALFRGSRSGK